MYKAIIFDFFDVIRTSSGELDTEVLRLIEQLSRSYKVALLTNASSGYVRQQLHEHAIEKYFAVVVIAGELGMVKPGPDIFNYALQQLSARPAEAIFIDDDTINTRAAEAVGIKSIVFTNAAQLRRDLDAVLH